MIPSKFFNENEHWIRCIIAIYHHLRNALLDILHDPDNGLPRDPKDLYDKLKKELNKNKFSKLIKTLSDQQIAILMPSCKRSNSQEWDNTLIIAIIRNFYQGLDPPKGEDGWQTKKPEDDDLSLAAYLVLAREIRNFFVHNVMDKFKKLSDFKLQWDAIRTILVGLKYKNMADFDANDCLYMIDLAVFRKAMQIGSNSTYECDNCGVQLDENKIKDVINDITEELKRKESEGINSFVFQNNLNKLVQCVW